MPKRKFVEFRDLPHHSNANGSNYRNDDRINSVLDHSKTALFRALKIARGFERQKLGRRQKTALAEKQLDHTRRLKLEILELKALDLAKTAESHLYKSLLKIKSISACDGLPERVRLLQPQGKSKGSVECLNVQARLFSSDVVQDATDVAIEGIRAALGVPKPEAGGKRRLRAKDYANGQLRVKEEESGAKIDVVLPVTKSEYEDEWEGISSSTSPSMRSPPSESISDADIVSVDGDDYERYASRLAAPSDASSSDNDSESLHKETSRSKLHLEQQRSNDTPSLSPSISLSTSPFLSPSPPPTLQDSARPSNSLRPINTKSTAFLPTLLTTGYYSGSDSDAISSNSYENIDQQLQPRKNRMGQQARRALWEKKFKDRANHLRNENGKGPRLKAGGKGVERDAGWDARKGAVGGKDGQMKGRGRRREGRNSNTAWRQKPTGANMDPVSDVRSGNSNTTIPIAHGSNKNMGDGPLHPSWEAARRAKKAKSVAKPMGKKVVF